MHKFNVLNSPSMIFIGCIDVHDNQDRSKHIEVMANCVKNCNFNIGAFAGFVM